MATPTNPLEFENRDAWRRWLGANHTAQTEAWLVIYKKKYASQGLALEAAVEEALCFGWIDGQLKPLDEQRFHLRFSPRSASSIWSMRNIQRVEKLIAAGKMTPAGQRAIEQGQASGAWEAALRREQVELIPDELARALGAHRGALAAYRALPPSRKKQYLYALQQAKRPDTRQRRIRQIVAEVLESRKPF